MGCLIELFLEIFIEGILSLVMSACLKLVHVFVPSKEITPKMKEKIKNTITTISVLLILILFIGVTFLLPPENTKLHMVGKYMTVIPLLIIGLQIVLGIIVTIIKIVNRHKK